MMRENFFKAIVMVGIIAVISACSVSQEMYILNEQFEKNSLGWAEEQTDFHYLDIRDGVYLIRSVDSLSQRSSGGSLAGFYQYNLPAQYEIATSMKLIEKAKDDANFGILLYSQTLEYKFTVFWDGEIHVTEYNFNNQSMEGLVMNKIELGDTDPVEIVISIDEMNFQLKVNGQSIGSGSFKTKTSAWSDIRMYTSSQSAILVDYLKIKEV